MKRLFPVLMLLATLPTLAVDSIRLKDTINKGIGTIDVFQALQQKNNPNASQIEQLRIDNNGVLVFAVDVNEAANGTEKAETQGVTLKRVELVATINGTERSFTNFHTPTSTLVAETGSEIRALYYTLLGETGSSRLTGATNADITSEFDGLLYIPVDTSLENATSLTLHVELLETNQELGDPEAFYDFSGGYEDVALLNLQDSTFLAELLPGADEAPLVIAQTQIENQVDAWTYYPSNDTYYVVSYEDDYPNRGDYDFNDLIVGYRVGFGLQGDNVVSMVVTGYMIARGADFDHDWYFRLPTPDGISANVTLNLFEPDQIEPATGYPIRTDALDSINIKVFEHTRSLLQHPEYSMVNTIPEQSLIKGHKFSLAIDIIGELAFEQLPEAPYDPYLHVLNTGYEIHLPGHAPQLMTSTNSGDTSDQYVDENGYPYALVFPNDWVPPLERIDLGEAYETYLNFTLNNEQQHTEWYKHPKAGKVKNIGAAFWKW